MKLRSLWRKRRDVMEFNDKEKASLVKQEILQALHDENVRLGLYDGVYAIDILEQENRLLRARNDRLEKELAMYQVQRLGQEIQPERDYERGFIDGMQKQMQSSVDKAVNRLAQPEQEPVAWVNQANLNSAAIQRNRGGQGDTHTWSETPNAFCPIPLYTTPPQHTTEQMRQWVGLTDEQMQFLATAIGQAKQIIDTYNTEFVTARDDLRRCSELLAAHGIKE